MSVFFYVTQKISLKFGLYFLRKIKILKISQKTHTKKLKNGKHVRDLSIRTENEQLIPVSWLRIVNSNAKSVFVFS